MAAHDDDHRDASGTPADTPYQRLGVLATQEALGPWLHHIELYTLSGLLTLLWHGEAQCKGAVIACGGAMGGLLGPDSLYDELGRELAGVGVATWRVSYRQPGNLGACSLDVAAAAELAVANGARHVVTIGHSFGGAVAVRVAAALPGVVAGVVTLATQSAGCEVAGQLRCPLLLFHGDRDEVLPVRASEAVRALAGQGELVVLPGAGHLMTGATQAVRERLVTWLPERLLADAGP